GGYSVPFRYGRVSEHNLTDFQKYSGLEQYGRVVDTTCFTTFDVQGPSPTPVPAPPPYGQRMALNAWCNAVDAGAILPNINDDFVGRAPDLGAYEYGQPLPTFGPRP